MTTETRYKQVLINIIRSQLPECRIWLFGSRARKTHKSGADFDIAIDAGRKLRAHELSEIKEAIEESSIPVFVDIVDVQTASEDFLNHIKTEWIEWKP